MNCRVWLFLIAYFVISIHSASAREKKDIIRTSEGKLIIDLLEHASIKFQFQNIILYCDPVFNQPQEQEKADIICLTHSHYDHFNKKSIEEITMPNTQFVYSKDLANKMNNGIILEYGEQINIGTISIKAVPAYNLQPRHNDTIPYHPKGLGNGYLIMFGELTVYVAGDTDYIPEMAELPVIDIAFLPLRAPYTMGKEQFWKAIETINPKRVYPYHTGITNLKNLSNNFISENNIELIIP